VGWDRPIGLTGRGAARLAYRRGQQRNCAASCLRPRFGGDVAAQGCRVMRVDCRSWRSSSHEWVFVDYDLFRLEPRSFEHLVQALCVPVIGPNVVVWAAGQLQAAPPPDEPNARGPAGGTAEAARRRGPMSSTMRDVLRTIRRYGHHRVTSRARRSLRHAEALDVAPRLRRCPAPDVISLRSRPRSPAVRPAGK